MTSDRHHEQIFVKDILQPEIPGCLPERKIDNHSRNLTVKPDDADADARRIVRIPLSSLPTYEAVAIYYSYIAYPHPDDATQRKNYSIALARWAVLERAKYDRNWNDSEQLIRPSIFSQGEKLFLDTRKSGSRRLWRHSHCAFSMLLPHVEPGLLDGLEPSVENISLRAGGPEGYSQGSTKTYQSDVWAPVKPVAHAAAAAVLYWGCLHDLVEDQDENYQICNNQPFLATLFFENLFKDYMLVTAEHLRLQMPTCSRFKITESETVRFIAD
jgi:hypothetical protein